MSWFLWLLLAALLLLPVLLRAVADEPDNTLIQVQPGDGPDSGDEEGVALAAA